MQGQTNSTTQTLHVQPHETLVLDTARGLMPASGGSTDAKLPDVCIRVKTHIKAGVSLNFAKIEY